jgi:hypothetical protein
MKHLYLGLMVDLRRKPATAQRGQQPVQVLYGITPPHGWVPDRASEEEADPAASESTAGM